MTIPVICDSNKKMQLNPVQFILWISISFPKSVPILIIKFNNHCHVNNHDLLLTNYTVIYETASQELAKTERYVGLLFSRAQRYR